MSQTPKTLELGENQVEETKDVCVTAILGGVLGLFSPLAVLSRYFFFIPAAAFLVVMTGFLIMRLHRNPMVGGRIALVGLYFSLFFGFMGYYANESYRQCEVKSARHFGEQWFVLMTTGRQMEALQLENPLAQRAKGVGILKRYTTDKNYIESYGAFMKNDAVRYILREFQGADIRFIRLENMSFSRRLTSYFVIFELSKGEGPMRKTRQFKVQIAAAKEYSEKGNRYEWTTRLIEVL